jgi:lysophospholipase L1-like esterase
MTWLCRAALTALLAHGIAAMADDAAPNAETGPLSRMRQKIAAGETVTLVLYGDSISEVGRSPRWNGGASAPAMNWGRCLASTLADCFPRATFTVRHFAIGGHNSYEGLGRLDGLAEFAPDVVFVQFGANDCQYHTLSPDQTYLAQKSLVDGIRHRHKCDVVVLGSGGDNPRAPFFDHLEETNKAIGRAASESGAVFVDVRAAVMKATRDGADWADYHLGHDNCHPNDAGHRVWADAVARELRKHLPPPES